MKQKSLVIGGLLILLALILFAMVGCAPVRYVYIDPKDSTVRKQRIEYEDVHIPLYFNYNWYSRPYYYYQPQRIIVTVPRNQSLPPRPSRGKH